MKFLFVLLFFNFSLLYNPIASSGNFKVELLQVIFRHGERSANQDEVYNNDRNDIFFKAVGYGQLTKVGRNRELRIGQLLRSLYDDFLGIYRVGDVFPYSTDLDRTRMSLQMVIMGLYPTTRQAYGDYVPIPTLYKPMGTEFLSVFTCPRYIALWNRTRESREFFAEKNLQKYQGLLELIRKNTGITTFNTFSSFSIFNNFKASLSMGLKVPSWVTRQNMQDLTQLARFNFDAMVYTDSMARKVVGPTIERILHNIDDHERGVRKEKIHLFSAHDFNVASFSIAHNFTNIPIIPGFGSAIIIEKIRSSDDKIFIRMLLWTGDAGRLIPLLINGCGHTCPIEQYRMTIADLLPTQEDRWCVSGENACERDRLFENQLRRTPRKGPILNLEDNDAKIAFASAGYDLLSFKYGNERLLRS